MPQKKRKPEEIVAKLRQVDVLLSQGRSVGEAVRTIGVLGGVVLPGESVLKILAWFRPPMPPA